MAVIYTDGSDGFEGDHIATIFIDSSHALREFEEKQKRKEIKKEIIKRFKKNQGRHQ